MIKKWLNKLGFYPCRCGAIHFGDYAMNDWIMHNCSHDGEKWDDQYMTLCADCGAVLAENNDSGKSPR